MTFKFKQVAPLILCFLLIVTSITFAVVPTIQSAAINRQLKFTLNGALVVPSGNDGKAVYPLTVDGTTYLPLRGVGNLLGYQIDYTAATKTIALTPTGEAPKSAPQDDEGTVLQPVKGVQHIYDLKFVLSDKAVSLTDAQGNAVFPVSYNGTTYLPLRALANLMALDIQYNASQKIVDIATMAVNMGTPDIAITPNVPIKAWKLVDVVFTDASGQSQSVLAGTTSTMTDTKSFEGDYKGDNPSITITNARTSGSGTTEASGANILAKVSYQVQWTAPPKSLAADDLPQMTISAKTLNTTVWKMPQLSFYFNQGLSGAYFADAKGNKYFSSDFSDLLTLNKAVQAGTANQTRIIQINLGNGYKVEYHYIW